MSRFMTETVEPADLAGLGDKEFRAVVDADLRRRVRPEGLPAAASRALRSPENVERWHTTLLGIQASVEGQIRAADDEYEIQRLGLEADIAAVDAAKGSSARLAALFTQANTLRKEHLSTRAKRERFLTGVREHLAMAESLRTQPAAVAVDSDERDRLKRRITRLEMAIELHRRAVRADLDDDEEPTPYEEALWEVLDE